MPFVTLTTSAGPCFMEFLCECGSIWMLFHMLCPLCEETDDPFHAYFLEDQQFSKQNVVIDLMSPFY